MNPAQLVLCIKAVQIDHAKRIKTGELDAKDRVFISLQLGLNKSVSNYLVTESPDLINLPIPFNLNGSIMFVTRDKNVENVQKLAEEKSIELDKVIGIGQLKKMKKSNLSSFDMVVCDPAIKKFLPIALGKSFFGKRQHVLIKSMKKWPQEIEAIRNSTFMHFGPGSLITIRLGEVTMKPVDLTRNLLRVFAGAKKLLPTGYSVSDGLVKSPYSPAIPMFGKAVEDLAARKARTVEPPTKKNRKMDDDSDSDSFDETDEE